MRVLEQAAGRWLDRSKLEPVLLVDACGFVVDANDTAARFALTIGRRWTDLFADPAAAAASAAFAEAREGRSAVFQAHSLSGVLLELVVTPLFDDTGRFESAFVVGRGRAAAVNPLEGQAQAYLRAVIDTEPECVKVVARSGELLEMNRAGLEMIEAPSLSVVRGAVVAELVAPEDRAAFREFHSRVCGGQTGTLEFDIVGLRGTRRRMESHAVPLRTTDGGFCQLAVTRDVTERRRTERPCDRARSASPWPSTLLAWGRGAGTSRSTR